MTDGGAQDMARGQRVLPHEGALDSSPMAPHATDPSVDHMLEIVGFQFAFDGDDGSSIFTPRPNSSGIPYSLPNGGNLSNPRNLANMPSPWGHHLPPSSNGCTDSVADISSAHGHVVQAKEVSPFPDQYLYRRQFSSPQKKLSAPTREEPPSAQTPQRRRRIVLRHSSSRSMSFQGEFLAQLSDISSDLWHLASSVPSFLASEGDTDVYYIHAGQDDERGSNDGFPIESMFKLSRRLVQSLDEIQLSGEDVDASHKDGSPLQRESSAPLLDPGTGLLILSVYVRLLDLYQKVFQNVQTEISLSGPDQVLRLCKLPDVSVGSFQVPPSPSLQMELTIRLAEEFLSKLRTAASSLGSWPPTPVSTPEPGSTSQSSVFSGAVEVSLCEIMAKEKLIGLELDKTRVRLAEMSSAP